MDFHLFELPPQFQIQHAIGVALGRTEDFLNKYLHFIAIFLGALLLVQIHNLRILALQEEARFIQRSHSISLCPLDTFSLKFTVIAAMATAINKKLFQLSM